MELEQSDDEAFFSTCNYFATKESAEAMAEKIRKVLKGADVIEMPSEEEYNRLIEEASQIEDEKGRMHHFWDIRLGYERCYKYLKSKILK